VRSIRGIEVELETMRRNISASNSLCCLQITKRQKFKDQGCKYDDDLHIANICSGGIRLEVNTALANFNGNRLCTDSGGESQDKKD
jgi:hypothetical protein